jgi:hypothetical protein
MAISKRQHTIYLQSTTVPRRIARKNAYDGMAVAPSLNRGLEAYPLASIRGWNCT